MHEVPAHRTASLIALKIVTTLQVDVVVLRFLTPFYLITSPPTLVIPKIFIISWSLLLLTFAISRPAPNFGRRHWSGGSTSHQVSFGGRLGFCLGRCPLRSYYVVGFGLFGFPLPWQCHDCYHGTAPQPQCRLHDHASSYSVASIRPSLVRSPSRSCISPLLIRLESWRSYPVLTPKLESLTQMCLPLLQSICTAVSFFIEGSGTLTLWALSARATAPP